MSKNLTSKDEKGRILVEGSFDICNIVDKCSGAICSETCIINKLIQRIYELEHPDEVNL